MSPALCNDICMVYDVPVMKLCCDYLTSLSIQDFVYKILINTRV